MKLLLLIPVLSFIVSFKCWIVILVVSIHAKFVLYKSFVIVSFEVLTSISLLFMCVSNAFNNLLMANCDFWTFIVFPTYNAAFVTFCCKFQCFINEINILIEFFKQNCFVFFTVGLHNFGIIIYIYIICVMINDLLKNCVTLLLCVLIYILFQNKVYK